MLGFKDGTPGRERRGLTLATRQDIFLIFTAKLTGELSSSGVVMGPLRQALLSLNKDIFLGRLVQYFVMHS